jgi:hypothetical protein
MRTANQRTFTTCEVSLKLRPNDPVKVSFDNIDWSFLHPLVRDRYSPQGADGYDPISSSKPSSLLTWARSAQITSLHLPCAAMEGYVSFTAFTMASG